MKRDFLPYYLSRAAISAVLSILVFGLTWKAALLALVLFGFFLLYLHSGWFRVDPSQPLIPLRRDDRGREIQRKALIAAVIVGIFAYGMLTQFSALSGPAIVAGPVALALGVVTYFTTQFALFAKG